MMSAIIKNARRSVCLAIILVTGFLSGACSAEESIKIVPPETETPKTLAVPRQVRVIRTARLKELKKQVESAENEVKKLEYLRDSLRTTYTEEYSKVKKVSKELDEAREKLEVIRNLL